MKHFTKKEDDFIRNNYLQIPASRMSSMLGRAKVTVGQRMKLLGIVVPIEIIEKFKRDSQIQKGNVSFNKGKRQEEYMSQEAINRTIDTRFKKGNLPPQTKTDNAISIRIDNRGVKYRFIRISLGKWVPLHRFIWEQSNGKIPSKMKLVFKDGDTMNCLLTNLELLTPGELMKRNSLHNYPKDISHTIQLRGALNRQINKHLKKMNNEKQD